MLEIVDSALGDLWQVIPIFWLGLFSKMDSHTKHNPEKPLLSDRMQTINDIRGPVVLPCTGRPIRVVIRYRFFLTVVSYNRISYKIYKRGHK